ncbi:MAG: TrbI/VirB10 family protein [Erythrobacter sp.]
MNFSNPFKRKPKQLDADDTVDVEEFGTNDAVKKRQMMLMTAAGLVALVAGSAYIFAGETTEDVMQEADGSEIKVSTDDMVNKNMGQQEWQAQSEAQIQGIEHQLRGVEGQDERLNAMQAQIAALQAENQAMAVDGQRVVSAYQTENDQLRQQISNRAATPAPPVAMYGPTGAAGGRAAVPHAGAAAAAAAPASSPYSPRSIKLVAFEGGQSGNATRLTTSATTSYTDSPNYLPPNSIAKARVIVGVDASAGVNSQTDPLPVVLRITGPARSVYRDGKLLTTKIEGCLVNGAARGDLSSEKVYVKLQRMTCPQANGRYAISDVKGFISFGGKTGVRGRVVSREGGLATQAFFAGLVSGVGNAFQGANAIPRIAQEPVLPSASDVGIQALGGGAASAGNTLSQYLIERAEQYQPVIEMPTGIDVEIVFLEGVFIQN